MKQNTLLSCRDEKNYSHLSKDERNELFVLRGKGYSLRAIARALNRSVCTVSTELRRNAVNGSYMPAKAHHKADVRRKAAKFQGKKLADNQPLLAFVETELLKMQSPAVIAGRLRQNLDGLPYVSRDTIEEYIRSVHGRRLEYELQLIKRRNRHRRKKRPSAESLSNRKNISERPPEIASRQRVGDVEADFIVSGKTGTGYLLTVVDRNTRVGFIRKILPVSIANMEQAFLDVKRAFPELKSITTDNDLLYRHHERLERLLGVPIYFCDPYSSWQKGTVENYNKVIRKYIPKGADISQCSDEYIQFVEDRLNGRFMDVLDYRTPQECMGIERGLRS